MEYRMMWMELLQLVMYNMERDEEMELSIKDLFFAMQYLEEKYEIV